MSLIGISYKGEAIAGVMFQPFVGGKSDSDNPGRLIYGVLNGGAYGFDKIKRDNNKFIVATTRTHSDDIVEGAIEKLKPNEVIRVGGAGFKALLILEGRADFYLFPTQGTKKWDSCAPEAILKANGGILTDKFGKTYPYFYDSEKKNNDGILASASPIEHQKIVGILDFKSKL